VTKSAYHHGDLRRVLIEAALELIAERGPAAISLRDLARVAGVSHAAPAHHFGDKAGLFTAIAVQGNELLAAALEGGDLMDMGARYVRFAAEHPSHFEVMFRPDLHHRDDPDLRAARDRTRAVLRRGVPDGSDTVMLAAWSLAHGFATLRRTGNLDRLVEGDSEEAFREIAGLLRIRP
jgi:AcrR family transcriptional regulator